MKYDVSSGYWVDAAGQRFVLNEFNPLAPTYIIVQNDMWTGERFHKTHALIWPKNIHPSLKEACEDVLKILMRRMSPSSLRNFKLAILSIVSLSVSEKSSLIFSAVI